MDNPVQVPALGDRGYDTSSNTVVAQTRLDEAWRALRREVPSLEGWLTAGDLDLDDVTDVVCAAALRVLRNPEGIEQESGGVDDYTETLKRADATLDIYFTAAELRRLQVPVPYATGFVGSIKYC